MCVCVCVPGCLICLCHVGWKQLRVKINGGMPRDQSRNVPSLAQQEALNGPGGGGLCREERLMTRYLGENNISD